jgi:hypothetical protein
MERRPLAEDAIQLGRIRRGDLLRVEVADALTQVVRPENAFWTVTC